MHDLTGELTSVSFSFHTGKPLLTFEMEDRQSALAAAENLFGDKLSIKVGRLIENIQEECRLQGIETKSAEEVESLLRQWE